MSRITDRVEEAVGAAIGAQRRRERTTAEMLDWLLEKGYGRDDSEEAVAQLVELGELDDERFALAYADDKRVLSGWGSERIEAALSERGLGAALVARAACEERDQELGRAVDQLLRRGMGVSDEIGRSKALGYLTRRGFTYELAYEAVRRAEVDDGARS